MSRTLTVSLTVADLKASKAFYAALGFVTNPQFTGPECLARFTRSESLPAIGPAENSSVMPTSENSRGAS